MCEVLISKEGPIALKPAILAIRVYWPILHAANVICITTLSPFIRPRKNLNELTHCALGTTLAEVVAVKF